jgi:hypothetical protein
MSATISTGPPDPGIGVAPQAGKARGARDEKHQADNQNGGANIARNRTRRQHICDQEED